MIKNYKKKPVVIQAVIWTGENREEIMEFANGSNYFTDDLKTLNIKTLEGNLKADIGDYIIKGIKGEFYPCKPDIFEQTYEEHY